VKSRVVWQLGPGKSSMIVPLRQLNVCRVVWLLKHPWVLEAIWKMWWDYPLSSTFVFRVGWWGCWSNRGSGTPFENVVRLSLYDQLLCSESDGVVAGAPEGPGRY